jgi:hypothetical protein
MGDDSAILPIGFDSSGNPIYPSGTTAGQLAQSAIQYDANGLPILNTSVNVTPSSSGTTVVTNPTSQPIVVQGTTVQPGQSVTIPASNSGGTQSSSTGLILMAVILGFFILSQK